MLEEARCRSSLDPLACQAPSFSSFASSSCGPPAMPLWRLAVGLFFVDSILLAPLAVSVQPSLS